MKRGATMGWAVTVILVLLAVGYRARHQGAGPAVTSALATTPSTETTPSTGAAHEGLLYGRITADDGAVYEGRLRWGGDEEALWGNYFNGFKDENYWATYLHRRDLPKQTLPIGIFGFEIARWKRKLDLGRPFMARFGDIARIDPRARDIRVTLKSGTVVNLDRFSADDLADGLRVWDAVGGFVDLGERQIRAIELLPTPQVGSAPRPLHGTVRTQQGDFMGLVQWNREECIGSDELNGNAADGPLSLRFDTILSIARNSSESSLITLLDGGEIVLSGTREAGQGNRGVYVDDHRYGRVLISWDAFERVDFNPGGTGPAYGDFPLGHPLTGSVITRSGHRLDGRLVYDLDESETTETLDAPLHGVDYTIPFGLIASIVPAGPEDGGVQPTSVALHSGERLHLDSTGDLGELNAGMLVFLEGHERPEYVPWTDIQRIDFHRPQEMFPPSGLR